MGKRLKFFTTCLFFSTIKSHLSLSQVFCSYSVFPLGWNDGGGNLGKNCRQGPFGENKNLSGLRGYNGTGRSAGSVHLLAEVRLKHPLWLNCMSLIRRMDWTWGWKAQKSL